MASNLSKSLTVILLLAMVAMVIWGILNFPDQRSTGERIEDAVNALPEGPDKAARQLEHRTLGEKVGDNVKDAGDDIKKSTGR